MRHDIKFDAEGAVLSGWFYAPEEANEPAPCVVMARPAPEPVACLPGRSLGRAVVAPRVKALTGCASRPELNRSPSAGARAEALTVRRLPTRAGRRRGSWCRWYPRWWASPR